MLSPESSGGSQVNWIAFGDTASPCRLVGCSGTETQNNQSEIRFHPHWQPMASFSPSGLKTRNKHEWNYVHCRWGKWQMWFLQPDNPEADGTTSVQRWSFCRCPTETERTVHKTARQISGQIQRPHVYIRAVDQRLDLLMKFFPWQRQHVKWYKKRIENLLSLFVALFLPSYVQ